MRDQFKKILKISVFTGFILLVLILTAKVNTASAESISREQFLAINLVNNIRLENGLNTLKWNYKLANAALDKANDMNQDKYFDHTAPDGRKAWDFIIAEGYEYKTAGENLAIDFKDVDNATVAWEKSPTHFKNIISSEFNEFGFAEINANIEGHDTKVFVQIFGTEKSEYDRMFTNLIEGNGG